MKCLCLGGESLDNFIFSIFLYFLNFLNSINLIFKYGKLVIYAAFLCSYFLKDLFNWFLNSFEDVLTAVSSVTIAEVARDNKEVQDAMAMEGAIPPLVALFMGKQLGVQVKGAMAVEALASYNPAIQRAFLEKSLSKYLLKLLKVGIL